MAMTLWIRELQRAVRSAKHAPAFAGGVVLVLGLALSMAISTSAMIEGVLLRPFPVVEEHRVVLITPFVLATGPMPAPLSVVTQLGDESRQLAGIAGVGHWGTAAQPYRTDRGTVVLQTSKVSSNFFDLLGTRAALGRLIRRGDERSGGISAAVLSHAAWRSHFRGDSAVVGARLLDPYTSSTVEIVGVAPPGLDYPRGVQAWTTIPAGAATRVVAVGRLAAAGTAEGARTEFASIVSRLLPEWRLSGAHLSPLSDAVFGTSRTALTVVAVAIGLLLLLACINTGALLLVRGSLRRDELFLRRALGARDRDLLRHLFVEGAVLAMAGGALGSALSVALLKWLIALAPAQIPRLDNVMSLEPVTVAAICLTAVVIVLFGVGPAVILSRGSSLHRGEALRATRGKRQRRFGYVLVVAQVAIAVVLVAGAGLLVRSLQHLQQLPLGFRDDDLWVGAVAMEFSKYGSLESQLDLTARIEAQLREVRGVASATPFVTWPFAGGTINVGLFESVGSKQDQVLTHTIAWESGGTDYFKTLDIRVLRGRGFENADRNGAAPVAVVSERAARQLWPDADAIGQRIRFSPSVGASGVVLDGAHAWRTIVGVVSDTRFRALRDQVPMVYLPWRQMVPGPYLAVRTSPGAEVGVPERIRTALAAVDPTLTLWNMQSMTAVVDVPMAEPRISAYLLSAFGSMALLLAAVGVYSAMSALVREETRSIGIRAALGATPRTLRLAVLARAGVIALVGTLIGAVVSLGLTRVLSALLFEVRAGDPRVIGAASLVLLAAVMVAAYLPSRRATKVDPMIALRGS